MFKKFSITFLSVLFVVFSLNLKGVYAYEFPSADYYVVVDSQTLGEVTIHIPSNQVDLLQIQEASSDIINISSGSVYGYINKGNSEYRVTFPVYATPTYRQNNITGAQTYNLNINDIIDTNISHLKLDYSKTAMDYLNEYATETNMFILVLFIFFVGVLRWLKH